MIKACIFDLDGTLLNTLVSIHYYLNGTLERHGVGSITLEECRTFVGNGAWDLVGRALMHLEISDEAVRRAVYEDYSAAYNAEPYYLTEIYHGITELLTSLSKRGILLGVLSNKQQGATEPLVRGFFGDTFSLVYGGREGVPLKPDPTVLRQMLDDLGVRADELMYVGDSGVDMKTGRNIRAGHTVGVLWGYRDKNELLSCGADVLISDPKEILNLL